MSKQKHTYMREAVPASNNGTCPCCLKQHRSTKRGVVTRHGWQETGRQVGSWGQGFQWGECLGWGKRPLEMTDADALVVLKALEKQIREATEAERQHATKGTKSYTQSFKIKLWGHKHDAKAHAKALQDEGLQFTQATIQVKLKGHRVYYESREVFAVEVPRSFEGVKIPTSKVTGQSWDRHPAFDVKSWEALRNETVQSLQQTIRGLEETRKHIQDAVNHHRDNPSNGIPVKTKGPVVHYVGERKRRFLDRKTGETFEKTVSFIACGTKALTRLETTSEEEVTCKRCLAKLAKNKA